MFIQRLLVPTDFSVLSRQAFRYAIALARSLSAEIDVLHVVPPPSKLKFAADAYLDRPLPTVSEETMAETRMTLNQMVSSVPHEGVRVNGLVEIGDPAATVVRVAHELPSDLVIIGTHARTGLTEIMIGSVAHSVITCSPCPVVTLRGTELRVLQSPSS